MTVRTEIKFNLKGLEDIRAKIGGTARARVGVLGGHADRDDGAGINNAELLLILMFGSLTNNIPPADPLLEPIIKHRRELMQALQKGSLRAKFAQGDYIGMLTLLGIEAEIIVQNAFETQGDGTWPKNADSTIKRKGSSMRNIDTSALRRSITSDVVKSGTLPPQGLTGAPNA